MKFEEKLAQAFKETCDERAERLMKVEKKHRFSLSYKLWERKMLRDLRRNRVDKRWTLRRARYAVTAMFAAFALLIGGTAYGAAKSRGFRFEETSQKTNLFLESYSTDKTTFEEIYWLPEEDGWIFTSCQVFGSYHDSLRLHFKRGDMLVVVWQNLITEGVVGHIFGEHSDVEMLSIYSENDGFVTVGKNDEKTTLGLAHNGYFLELVSDGMSKDELTELAYSVTTVTFEEFLEYDDPQNLKPCKDAVQRITGQA
ncbi:MAG: hypothetical protein K2N56_03400 [Oscillospiraceae bacterium]|nr:hypothetical protein [Oscillospiraceae bacterium]